MSLMKYVRGPRIRMGSKGVIPPNPDAPAECLFCRGDFIVTSVVYRDEDIVVIDDIKPEGQTHWLVMPLRHIRSVEELTVADLPLYRKMLEVRETLLQTHFPDLTPATRMHRLRSGFHRGGREIQIFGTMKVSVPDVISVKHLHLHVVVDLNSVFGYIKFPLWNELIFHRSEVVLKRLEDQEKLQKDVGEDIVEKGMGHSEL